MRKDECLKMICEVFGMGCKGEDPISESIEALMRFAGIYVCPVRRGKQWMWRDVEVTLSQDEICCECGEVMNKGSKSFFVHNNDRYGHRCNFCHKISLEHCSPLGHLRETVKRKHGLDYVTGEFVEKGE